MDTRTSKLTLDLVNNKEVLGFVREIWLNNFSGNGFEHLVENIFEELRNSQNLDDILKTLEKNLSDQEFKRFNRKIRKNPKNLNEFGLRLLEPYLRKSSSYLDYGCGRMALIRRIIRDEIPDLHKIYGFEPKADMAYFGLEGKAEFLSNIEEVKKLENIDLITFNYVLHHLTDEEINEALNICKNILSPKGQIIVAEESYFGSGESGAAAGKSSNQDSNSNRQPPQNTPLLTSLPPYLINCGYERNEDLTKSFESLSAQTKKQIIFLNDILMNYKNLHYMPWTMEYHSIEEWVEKLQSLKLKVQKIEHLGFVKGAKAKGGTTTVFELRSI